jgi:transposase
MSKTDNPASLAPADVATRLGVGVGKVLGWIKRGQLRAIDVASEPGPGKRRRFRVKPADLAAPPVQQTRSRKPTRNTEQFL